MKEEHSSSIYALAASTLKQSHSWILSHPEYQLSFEEEEILKSHQSRLISGEPLAYITGIRSFFGYDFEISPDVLIPRPETELLVEQAIQAAELFEHPLSIADVGTGSGCVSISLAKSFSDARILATDNSLKALQIASKNIYKHNVENRIHLVQSNVLDCIDAKFHIICANLPYIPTKKLDSLSITNFEPRNALNGGKDGLIFIKQLFQEIDEKLHPKGMIIIEIESTQKSEISNICNQSLPSASCKIIYDLAGLPRTAVIRIE